MLDEVLCTSLAPPLSIQATGELQGSSKCEILKRHGASTLLSKNSAIPLVTTWTNWIRLTQGVGFFGSLVTMSPAYDTAVAPTDHVRLKSLEDEMA
eukprot:564783-Amphidinium_carterae.1